MFKKLNRMMFIISLVVVVLFVSVLCQAQGVTVTVEVLGVEDPWYFALEKVTPQFEKETGIRVKIQGLSLDVLYARIVTSFVSKQASADVIGVDNKWLAQYAENGWIIPLTSYIKRDKQEVRMNEFIAAVINGVSEWRGEIYTLPIAAYSQFVMYRKDLLAQAGLSLPPTEQNDWWTWDKYMEYVEKVDALGEDVYGTVICGAQPSPIVDMYTGVAASKGVRWFKQFPEAPWDFTPAINSEENIEALNYYKKLYQHSPAEAINYVWFDAGTAFSTKDVGMFFWWSPYGYLVRQAGYMVEEPSPIVGKYDVAPMPYQPGYPEVTNSAHHGLAIATYSAHKEEAWEFIKWATSGETQKNMALCPPYLFNDFSREYLFRDEECLQHYPWLSIQLGSLKQSNNMITRPAIPIHATLEGVYGLQLNTALGGMKGPEAALADVESQWDTILKQNFFIPYRGESYDHTIENTQKLINELSQ